MDDCTDVQDHSYEWEVKQFSNLKCKIRSPTFLVDASEETKCAITLYPYGFILDSKEFISIFINISTRSISAPIKYELTISILSTNATLNVSKKTAISCEANKSFWGFYWFMRREELFGKSDVYLPEDVLTIQCYTVRKRDMPDISICEKDESPHQNESRIEGLNNDLHCLNLDDKLSEIKIETLDRTFTVHKYILCAKSPVFSAMFENDTEVKESDTIHITDLDSETVNLMLTFMNSDDIEHLTQAQALKLYSASDIYKILPLKQHCCSVLKKRLSDVNIWEMYTLADMHQDKDLKAAVEEYVFIYSNRILKSSEWKDFMNLNNKLSAEFMYKLWIKQLDG